MKKRVAAVLVLTAMVAMLWWWQRPESRVVADGSLLGMLADDDRAGYAVATDPGVIKFPRDFGPHDDFQAEWWYYTGNLETVDGRLFGYELTFFRKALAPPGKTAVTPDGSSWRANQIYSAHFVLSDIANRAVYPEERFGRKALGLAGATAEPYSVWLEDWHVRESDNNSVTLSAATQNTAIDLRATQTLPPILEGNKGLSVKNAQPGGASYYYSVVRQETRGTVTVNGQTFAVSGLTWNDHEYFTHDLSPEDVGWDWFALQFDNGTALMVYQIRQEKGCASAFSGGSFISSDGTVTHLELADSRIETKERWTSHDSGATYPVGWRIEIERIGLNLTGAALMPNHELRLSTTYWEGPVAFDGRYHQTPIRGRGYVEMTGYSRTPH
jgi:predicted secreted hydrolase